ncbi:MAG TPA: hypothetical protein VNV85_10670 [Puia sp.]|nr:hypothetical protein [Puia sp.]
MLNQPAYALPSGLIIIIKCAFFAIAAVYLLDCFTPLRLHYDSVRYYAIKDCIEFGCPPDSAAANDYFPYGYTVLLLLLSKLGILKSFSIVLINSIFLVSALYFLYKVFEGSFPKYLFFFIVMINWLFVKFVTHPLSEMQYLFFSLASVLMYYRFTQQKKIGFLLLSLFFGWLAFMTRTVGITLVGAIAVGLVWEYRVQQIAFFKKNKFWVIGILVVITGALVVFSKPLGINHYGSVLSEHFKEAPFFKRMGWRFKEWGELFINAPSNKVIDRLAGEAGRLAYEAVGFIIFCWFVYVVYFRKNNIPFFIKAYILFYCIIMFNWPFNDPRFWVPIMPIIAAVVLQALFATPSKILKVFSLVLLVVYIALGAFASGYMVYTSLNKKVFARTQAKGTYRSEYEIHFYGKPLSDTVTQVDKDVIELLRRYD